MYTHMYVYIHSQSDHPDYLVDFGETTTKWTESGYLGTSFGKHAWSPITTGYGSKVGTPTPNQNRLIDMLR